MILLPCCSALACIFYGLSAHVLLGVHGSRVLCSVLLTNRVLHSPRALATQLDGTKWPGLEEVDMLFEDEIFRLAGSG